MYTQNILLSNAHTQGFVLLTLQVQHYLQCELTGDDLQYKPLHTMILYSVKTLFYNNVI